MAKEFGRPKPILAGAAGAVLLAFLCTPGFASQGFKSDCDEMNEAPTSVALPTPVYTLKRVDHGLTDSAADMKAPATDPSDEEVSSPALADVADSKLEDAVETEAYEKEVSSPADELPETALRLPGVSEEDHPRFRRQMYRTDI